MRAATSQRTEPWDVEELRAVLPQPLKNQEQWKLTASHNPIQAVLAADGNPATRFDTGAAQKPGMWFQVELSLDGANWGLPVASGKVTGR